MKTVILYDHPYDGSLNREILNRVIKKLNNSKKEFEVIDFSKVKFDPTYSVEELALYNSGATTRDDVKKYQELLLNCDEMYLIFPIWWNYTPPSTKGFFDLVFKYNFAWKKENNRLIGMLNHIKKATIISTSNRTTESMIGDLGNSIGNTLIKATLNDVGIEDCFWINIDQVKSNSNEEISRRLDEIFE